MGSSGRAMTDAPAVFQLKGGLYTLTAIQLQNPDLLAFPEQLDIKIQQAPKFFHNIPVIIDLQKVNSPGTCLDFKLLKETLLSRHLIPVGIKGGNQEQQAAAISFGFAILPDGNNKEKEKLLPAAETVSNTTSPLPVSEEPDIQGSNTRVITEPVRSGQQIYARGGDLVVLAPVGHGSELLADGHIHVYGPLRGRALAGVTGDTSAHIFCQSLEAELISIAGQYKISEDIERIAWRIAANIQLESGHLQIRAL